MIYQLVFYVFAFLITVCSVAVVLSRNPIASAMFLVGDLFLLAGLYALMEAHFVAAIQILVYAGAITVLFVFVIMLLNLGDEARRTIRIPAPELAVLVLTFVGFIAIGVMLGSGQETGVTGELTPDRIAAAGGNTYAVGMVLFTRYLWPFELASILILLAVVASVVIAQKRKDGEESQPKRRVAHGTR